VTGGAPRVLVIQNETTGHLGQLDEICRVQGLDLDVRVVDADDPVPSALEDAAGLVVLGAVFGVGDAPEHPYLYRVMDLIRDAAREGTPALGLCLGGQLAAVALGGTVRLGAGGLELGWLPLRTTPQGRSDPVAGALGSHPTLFEWHADEFDPPPGAVQLLTGERYPYQGFRVSSVWGFQPHLEIDLELVSLWCAFPEAAAHLEEVGITSAQLLAETEARRSAARRALEAWARLVASRVPAQ
jgi:GMP synthase (glutamine-hydrolysing)